jgi:hypothetical protein
MTLRPVAKGKSMEAGCSPYVLDLSLWLPGDAPPPPLLPQPEPEPAPHLSEKAAKLAQKLGQLQPFINDCVPAGMHGPTCVFWANLTPFWLQTRRRQGRGARLACAGRAACASPWPRRQPRRSALLGPSASARWATAVTMGLRRVLAFVLPLIHFIAYLLTHSVPLFPKRQYYSSEP